MKLYIKVMYVLVVVFIVATLFSIYRRDWVWSFIGVLGVFSTLYSVKQLKEASNMLKEALDTVSDEKPI
ncbi:hypothetical protein [Vagococcus penaei]|nr:hypothetical protein [Vagococcus penaei]